MGPTVFYASYLQILLGVSSFPKTPKTVKFSEQQQGFQALPDSASGSTVVAATSLLLVYFTALLWAYVAETLSLVASMF